MQQNVPIRISVQRVISYPFDYLSNELRIIWVLEGSLQVKFVSGIIELHANDAEIVNINIPVGLQATDKNLVAIFSIDSEFAKTHFGSIDKMSLNCNLNYIFPRLISERERSEFTGLLSEIALLYFSGKAAPEELTEKSCALLRYLVGHFNSVTNMLQNMPNAELHFSRFENINEFIQDNLSEKLTLSAVASREFLSTQYLAGEFKKRYGITFNEMLNYYRVIHSVQLLLSTELSITDICSRCGFSATRYYYKYFKKYLLITPHEFRRNNKRSHRKICDYQELSPTESWACFSRSNDSPHYAAPRPVKKVLLLNPNTNPAATARIEKVARATFSPNILVKTSSVSFGPDVLRSPLDETISELAVTETLLEHKDNYDGVIIACFSDLGKAVKPLLHVPAISVAEAAYYSACLLGEHFSVITSGGDLERKLIGTTIERCGLTSRCLSIKSLYIDFLDITPETALAPLERLVQECKEKDCADVVVLACVSLAGMGEDISRRLKIPVIDGVTQSALFMEAMLHTEWTKLIQNTVPCTPSTLTGSIYTNHIEELYSL